MGTTFRTVTHAKCILAGEHAVLRNYTLLAKSIRSYQFELEYSEHDQLIIELNYAYETYEGLNDSFKKLLQKAYCLAHQSNQLIDGHFILKSNIPLSAGLGFSAAICVAVTNWVIHKGWIPESNKFEFAKSLEDMFHGESSGADIAACLSDQIIVYKRRQPISVVFPAWQPNLYLQQSDVKSVTQEAIAKVVKLHQENPQLGKYLDEKMNSATLLIIEALKNDSTIALKTLATAFNYARECFEDWDLIPEDVAKQISVLKSQGALAVKPTGAGNGGCLLSLWKDEPGKDIRDKLISVF